MTRSLDMTWEQSSRTTSYEYCVLCAPYGCIVILILSAYHERMLVEGRQSRGHYGQAKVFHGGKIVPRGVERCIVQAVTGTGDRGMGLQHRTLPEAAASPEEQKKPKDEEALGHGTVRRGILEPRSTDRTCVELYAYYTLVCSALYVVDRRELGGYMSILCTCV